MQKLIWKDGDIGIYAHTKFGLYRITEINNVWFEDCKGLQKLTPAPLATLTEAQELAQAHYSNSLVNAHIIPSSGCGWECPRCHTINAPHISQCSCTISTPYPPTGQTVIMQQPRN